MKNRPPIPITIDIAAWDSENNVWIDALNPLNAERVQEIMRRAAQSGVDAEDVIAEQGEDE